MRTLAILTGAGLLLAGSAFAASTVTTETTTVTQGPAYDVLPPPVLYQAPPPVLYQAPPPAVINSGGSGLAESSRTVTQSYIGTDGLTHTRTITDRIAPAGVVSSGASGIVTESWTEYYTGADGLVHERTTVDRPSP